MRHLTLGRVRPVTWPSGRGVLGRYAAAWAYLAAFVLAELIDSALPGRDQSLLLHWASTNVVNLHHHPVGATVVSALIAPAFAWAWPALIALALFGANRVLGNWGTALLCVTGHVAGTLVSEGIVAYRTAHGLLPEAANRIVDVGPSYVVVSAITVAVLFGSWPARAAAALDLALLVFVGDIFSGLTALQVAAVGHVTAIVVSVPLGIVLARRARRQPPPESAESPESPVPDVSCTRPGPSTSSPWPTSSAAGRCRPSTRSSASRRRSWTTTRGTCWPPCGPRP